MRSLVMCVALSLTLEAGVTWDETVRNASRNGSVLVRSRVPGVDPPLFDIPLDLYAPPMRGAPSVIHHFVLDHERLARIGPEETMIFDLSARTITVVRPRRHTYSVETLEDALQRLRSMLNSWRSIPPLNGKFSALVQKTGRTRQVGNQNAEEYRIISIGPTPGPRRVHASSVYWMAPDFPSQELAVFTRRWAAESGLPFPGMPAVDDGGFGVMARAASRLPGYPICYVVVNRPVPGPERTFSHTDGSPRDEPSVWEQMGEATLMEIRATETVFSNFATGPVHASVFSVPAGYKKKKPYGYTF